MVADRSNRKTQPGLASRYHVVLRNRKFNSCVQNTTNLAKNSKSNLLLTDVFINSA